MSIHRSAVLALPLVFVSSLAFADEAKPQGATNAQHNDKTTTVLGQDVTQADDDPDLRVGQTETTAADPSRRDVVESRAELRRDVHGRRVELSPLFGYGTNDLNVGVGARAGYTFETPVYVGGTFLYHFGSDGGTPVAPGAPETQSRHFYPGVEAGYDIGIGPALIRPYAGAAMLFSRVSTEFAGNTTSNTNSSVMVYPGLTAQYFLPQTPVHVGADTRVLIPFEGQSAAFSAFLTAGLHL